MTLYFDIKGWKTIHLKIWKYENIFKISTVLDLIELRTCFKWMLEKKFKTCSLSVLVLNNKFSQYLIRDFCLVNKSEKKKDTDPAKIMYEILLQRVVKTFCKIF